MVVSGSLYSEADRIVLVTGGAGYIGSHTCKALKEAGFTPVVYDSLAFGEKEAVKWGPLCEGDLLDRDALDRAFVQYQPEAVFHFAALRNVRDSVADPGSYYTNNIVGSINLLNAMIKHQVKYLVFSSSCTVFGDCSCDSISEESPQAPISPYGVSKQVIERIIQDYAHAYPLKYMILRYFNVAGLDTDLKRSVHTRHFLIPRAVRAVFEPDHFVQIFGSDYATEDGTAVRDYIHVKDVASAHVMTFHHLLEGKASNHFNLGAGRGYSVLEIIRAVEEVTGFKVPYAFKPRKEGEASSAVAEIKKAKEILEFEPKVSDLKTMIQSEWDAFLKENRS
ncbi:MAG: UDP-glucose 4-epimerase GalE [Chlamydiae bacterium RIFCSPHIGHO2_12_FULL_44_59]|nr:MAG: UDP-glucose 4-epimerase GalE [Chlamydiae bacterium RIFCSPHIGHO2_01_FULL_44_39]OGN57890.1 MAG: UDP-glucose 4-epimerase GalE [Chlamydiae bacterium RIFCSPHIGHO2_02_FULL_45_9]OGN60300.1 MAG: UDP-glucose 4-epimerase GalE [Chlamydiae bacterium RIFCSPHIGHO2_12_FULL_44_59]OGN67196.1 MAG: UDP-glucose 4-epimerase GalE [Chlamydiae bacterium RIFCSPLOWO2_01_FULL_44_52]OGN67786.1 MAG: UDP-glucose 4-epimerase GalE [Chlamydiae bacterium RIFCSPLOWO2_02_FULL_45_22]OGN71488.1 MAG: UDP-glucose 4-epimerase